MDSTDTQIADRRSSIVDSGGFTLIELLVVISILALLMAVLLPALSRVRKQAKAVVCQSRLRELGLLCAVYKHEDIGPPRSLESGHLGLWRVLMREKWVADRKLRLCPSALKPLAGPPVPYGDTFHAYAMGQVDPAAPPEKRSVTGYASYGINAWVDDPSSYSAPGPWKWQDFPRWRTCDVKGASRVPVFFDCVINMAGFHHVDPPPKHPYAPPAGPRIYPNCVSVICIDRHHGAVNMLFMDWSVDRVGLKGLWTLKWHGEFNTRGRWTQAGDVQPEDWPEWMRGFKDY